MRTTRHTLTILALVAGLAVLAPVAPARADDDDEAREKLVKEILEALDERLEKVEGRLREDILDAIERRLAKTAQPPRAAPSPRSSEKELWFADGWCDFGEGSWRHELEVLETALEGYRGFSSIPARPTLEALAQLERRLERYERALLQGYWSDSEGARRLSEESDKPLWFDGKWAQWGSGSWRDYFEDLEVGLEKITTSGYSHTRSEVDAARKTFKTLQVRFQRYERALLEGGWSGERLAKEHDVPLPLPPAETRPEPAPLPAEPEMPPAVEPPSAPVRGGFLGVQLGSLDEADPRWRGKLTHGLLIVEVLDGTPADEAGLREGDVITEVDGKFVTELSEFIEWIGQHAPGDEVKLGIFRKDWQRDIVVKLGKRK